MPHILYFLFKTNCKSKERIFRNLFAGK